ncbi:MAG: hypothetical protein JEZ05_08275 [Tenericutes bacterium]|nr:hypothetical protein [Mycoplasmatota bacterium]
MINYLDYSTIQVNPENFRHNPVLTEDDAMIYLINDTISDTIDLCRKMIKFGFREQEVLTVVKFDDQEYSYKALDGNRRLTCLKLLFNDIKLPIHPKYKKLADFIEESDTSKINKMVPCIVHEKENTEVYEYIRDKHVSSEGTEKKWDSKQQRRFDKKVFNKITLTESIVRGVSDELYESLKNVTTMDRMLNSIEKRQKLGIKESDNRVVLPEQTKIYISQIVNDINNGGLTSRTVNSRPDTLRYIGRIISELNESEESSNPKNESNDSSKAKKPKSKKTSNSTDSREEKKTTKKKAKVSNLRSSLIPKSSDLASDNNKIELVINELKGLSIHTYTFAVAILFRTFIELCLIYYSSYNKFGYNYEEQKLQATLMSALNITYGKNTVDRNYHTNIKTFLNEKRCIHLLNGYVHDLDCHPDRVLLIDMFNNLERFISDILLKRLENKLF